jgi:hypothetical protein
VHDREATKKYVAELTEIVGEATADLLNRWLAQCERQAATVLKEQ